MLRTGRDDEKLMAMKDSMTTSRETMIGMRVEIMVVRRVDNGCPLLHNSRSIEQKMPSGKPMRKKIFNQEEVCAPT